MMTNQNIGGSSVDRLIWWGKNKNETQAQWIREGFKKSGIVLQNPLWRGNILSLLRLLGEKEKAPDSQCYNAFRWLRDNNFRFRDFNFSEVPEEKSDVIVRGMNEYCFMLGLLQKANAPGILSLGEPPASHNVRISIANPSYIISVYILGILIICAGIVFILKTWKFKMSPKA